MQKLLLELPINQVSFGKTSLVLLKTAFEREKAGTLPVDISLFPVGNVDLSGETPNEEFQRWLQTKITKAYESHSRETPCFKLWHLNGSLQSYSNRQTLLSFYETDSPTKIELNIARNNNLCFSSKYTCDVFKIFGCETSFLPLGFDSYNFKKIDKQYHTDGRIVFSLTGKFEHRKHHARAIQTWVKKYGGNARYALQCATWNSFYSEQQNNDAIRQALNGAEKPFNVSFYPFMREDSVFNDFLNSVDIALGVSGGEGFDVPVFQSVALGKHAVLLQAHAYKSWATPEMVTFIAPNGKIPAYDDIFFKQGQPFNQGNFFSWSEDDFVEGCEKAIKRVEANRFNEEGTKIQEQFSKEKFLDNVIRLSLPA
jgi:hypothetical protein